MIGRHMALEPVAPDGGIPDWPSLASSQISALAEGSAVIAVRFSNDAPQRYKVHRQGGRIYARSAADVTAGILDRDKVLTFVSRVWLPRV